MAGTLEGRRIAFVVSNEGIEDAELVGPWDAVEHEGGTPVLVATEEGKVQTFNHLSRARTFAVDQTTAAVFPEDFDGVVVPGGVANADHLREDAAAVSFVARACDLGRPLAVICHGPWVLVEADRVRGRTLTSWPSLQRDIVNAGGTWVDQQVVVCTNGPNVLVSSRKPDDLAAFNREMVRAFADAERASRAA